MTQRIDYQKQAPELFHGLVALNMLVNKSSIEESICDLVDIRASQINGCGFCLDMHIKQAVMHGERPLRLHHLAIWRESTLFSPRERAALAWTEALTQLSEKELTDLSYAVMAINAWNRINVAFRSVPGSLDKAFGLDKSGLA
jgi:AhpD family alkylhydroperoxidase